MARKPRIGILTGGGDVPGLNSVIKSVTYRATELGYEVLGIRRGWEGLTHHDPNVVPDPRYVVSLTRESTRTIDRTGGTMLHTSRTKPAQVPRRPAAAVPLPEEAAQYTTDGVTYDLTPIVVRNIERLGLDYLVPIGGDDTLSFAQTLHDNGVPLVAIPKTMDNDVQGTEYCIGFSTAITRAKELINRQRDIGRFAWPHVAGEVMGAYEDAIATPEPQPGLSRAAVKVGVRAADLKPHQPARKLPSLEPRLGSRHSPLVTFARRAARHGVARRDPARGAGPQKIGMGNITSALLNSSPAFVLLALAIMCPSMVFRAISWHAILTAALPHSRVRLADAMQGTFIGVLMSSTLPARLGEPSRALVVARRTGRPRETCRSCSARSSRRTLLSVLALVVLGAVMFSSVDIFSGHQTALLVTAIAPLALLVLVLLAPAGPALPARQVSRR